MRNIRTTGRKTVLQDKQDDDIDEEKEEDQMNEDKNNSIYDEPAVIPDPVGGVVLPDIETEQRSGQSSDVSDEHDGAIRMAFIGAGQGGGRMAEAFWGLGYRRVVAVNTAAQDLKLLGLPEENKLVVGKDPGGAGKDPSKGETAVKDSSEDVMDTLFQRWGESVEQMYVLVGAGGGSGTGALRPLVEAAHGYARSTDIEKPFGKRVGVIMSLPKRSEGARVQANALSALMTAQKMLKKGEISSLVLVDNARTHELFSGLPVKKFWPAVNRSFAGVLHTFNVLASQDSEYSSFDRADLRSVLCNGAMVFGTTRVDDWSSKESVSQAVRRNVTGTLLAEGFELSGATVAASVVVAHDDVLGEVPMENIDHAFNGLARVIGNEGVTLHTGIYEGSGSGMVVFTMISGMALPQSRIDELKLAAK